VPTGRSCRGHPLTGVVDAFRHWCRRAPAPIEHRGRGGPPWGRANLQNHPIVYLAAHLAPEARQSPNLRPAFNTALRFSATSDPRLSGDLQMLVLNKSPTSWPPMSRLVRWLGGG
jgi:hypothetical protein